VIAKRRFGKQEQKRVRRPSLVRSRGTRRPLRGPHAAPPPPPLRWPPNSARITLEHIGIDMRVDEVLPLHEQALCPASGGVPSLPGVEEVVCAMNKVGELVTTARRRRSFRHA
jgi:hypothetical protein